MEVNQEAPESIDMDSCESLDQMSSEFNQFIQDSNSKFSSSSVQYCKPILIEYPGLPPKTESTTRFYPKKKRLKKLIDPMNNDEYPFGSSFISKGEDFEDSTEEDGNLFGFISDNDDEDEEELLNIRFNALNPTQLKVKEIINYLKDDIEHFSQITGLIDDGIEWFLEWTYDPHFETMKIEEFTFFEKKIKPIFDLVELNRMNTNPKELLEVTFEKIVSNDPEYGVFDYCDGCKLKKQCTFRILKRSDSSIIGKMGKNCAEIYINYQKLIDIIELYRKYIIYEKNTNHTEPQVSDTVLWFCDIIKCINTLCTCYIK